jgi:uncharacterized membrane protein
MNKTLLIIGFVVLILGIAATFYSETTTESHLFGLYSTSSTSNPYSAFSIPLLVGGIVLIIVAAVLKSSNRK